MTQQRGPTVNRRNLGAELRRLRLAAGFKIDDAAKRLACSSTRVSRIESGHQGAVAKPTDVRTMAEMYGVKDERQVDMLLDMLSSSQQIGWWEAYDDVLPSGLEVLVGLETDAQAERAWEPLLVHGLLQTADYAREILSGWGTQPGDIADLVEVRAKRQESLTRDSNPLVLWAVMDEGTVRRPIGRADVMRAQVNHLIEFAELPNVHLQLLRTNKGAHPGLGGAFSILEFAEDQPVVYLETTAGNLYLEKRPDVRKFTGNYQMLGAMALPFDETTALLKSVAKEL